MNINYDYVLQEDSFDCGIASLITIFKQYKKHITKEQILEHINIENGINAYDLINASKILGLDSRGVKGSLKDLNSSILPCISHVIIDKSYYHYIVILKQNKLKKTLLIMDPSYGIKEITEDEFEDMTTGIYILFDGNNLEKEKNNRLYKFLTTIFKENKKIIKKELLISIIFILISIIFNNYLKQVIDSINKKQNLFIILIIFIFIMIIKNIIDYIKNKLSIRINHLIDKQIYSKVINHIFSLPYKYFLKKSIGELNLLLMDIENFKNIISKLFIVIIIDIVIVLNVLIYLLFSSLISTIIMILFIFILIFISKKYQYTISNDYKILRNNKMKNSSSIINYLMGVNTIKNLHIESFITDNLNKTYNETLKSNEHYLKHNNVYNYLNNNTIDITYIFIIFILSIKGVSNTILFSSLFILITPFIFDICNTILSFKVYENSINKVLDLLEIEKENLVSSRLENIKTIEFKNIHFSYNNKKVLQDINFIINKNDRVLIKGPSGSGKSTLIKLLLRHFSPNKGKILIDNINISNLDLDYIRNNITYVSQNEVLFNDTIKNNILLNKNEENLKKALDSCLIKNDLDTLISDNSINISGGEKKKILIARALLRSKSILILDESFNEISIKEEKTILNNIFKNYPNLTIILISHRNSNEKLFNKKITINKEEV